MRMWMIPANLLCKNHLLGEHNEIHKHKHNFEKKHSIKGRIYPKVIIEPNSMKKRHDELAKEMINRKYNHKSPYEMPNLLHLIALERYAKVDLKQSIKELCIRCEKCKKNIIENNI